MHWRRDALTIILVTLALSGSPVFAGGSIPAAEVVSLLRSAKIVNADFPIRAMSNEKDMTIFTRRRAKSSESDVKIDAMLIAKTLFDCYANQLHNVSVLFSTEADPEAYTKVSISQQEVKDFGSGKMSETQLLQSLQVVHQDDRTLVPEAQVELQPGPFMEQRMALQSQIQDLKQGGTDTKPFETLFGQVELSIKKGDSVQARAQLSSLADKLQEQIQLRKEANVPINHPKRSGGQGDAGPARTPGASKAHYAIRGVQRLHAIVEHFRTAGSVPGFVFDDLTRAQDSVTQLNNGQAEVLLEEVERAASLPDTFVNLLPSSAEITVCQRSLMELHQNPGQPQGKEAFRQRRKWNRQANWGGG